MMTLAPRTSVLVRIAPFVAFVLVLALRGALPALPDFDARWLYGLGVLVPGAMLVVWWREYGELARPNWPGLRQAALGAGVGLAVFGAWIQLDAPWMQIGTPAAVFVPVDDQGRLQWPLIALRCAGAVLLVPLMEEIFWRSFLMRWVQGAVFESVDPRRVGLRALIVSTFVFVLVHNLWLAAIVAGLAYALLYRQTGKLWVAVIAHATTNAALAAWVVAGGHWQFW